MSNSLQPLQHSRPSHPSLSPTVCSKSCILSQWCYIYKLQYFGHLMQRDNSLEKTLMLGQTEGKSRSGWQRMRWLDRITNSMDMNLGRLQEIERGAWQAAVMGSQRLRHDLAAEQQIYIPHLYPLIHQWTLRLFLYLGCYK